MTASYPYEPQKADMTELILDTDIGTDVDDALALGLVLGSPEATLLGVTTVYGDTLLRARLARRLARFARPQITVPFIPGAEATLSGREVWWPGHEGKLFDDLDEEPVASDRDAVDFLVASTAAAPGRVDVLAIGPLTNIALALRRDPAFARNTRRLVVMGGDFAAEGRIAEHNFRCDATAAREVFESELDILVTGLDVTTRVALAGEEIERIERAGAFGTALRAEIEQFWRFHGKPWNNPHDPVAVLAGLRPDLFATRSSGVTILDSGEHPGLAIDTPDAEGTVRIVSGLDEQRVVDEVVDRITAAPGEGAA